MDSAIEEEVEESRVDMEVGDNGWDGGKAKDKALDIHGDVVEDEVEIMEGKKGKESRESRRKRKEREAAGDVVEDAEAREERKKRRDEKDKRRGKDLDENERRDHRESRDKKDAKRKKGKENKERKERRDERHGTDREVRVKEDSKDSDLRDASDRRERREKRLERKDVVDDGVHLREFRDRDGARAGTSDKTYSRKDDLKVSSHVKSAVVDDEQEEGEILDEDSCPAKDLESGEIYVGEDAGKRDGVQNETAATTVKSQGKSEKSRWESPPLETPSSLEETKIERRERGTATVDRTSKSSSNALQSMIGIAEAYDSESQASDEKPVASAGVRSEKLHHAKEAKNGGPRSEGPDLERSSGSEKLKALDKLEAKKHSMGPPDHRGIESKDKKSFKSGETRSRHEVPKVRSSQGLEVGHGNHTNNESPNELSLIASSKGKHSRHSLSPAVEDSAHGKRGNGGRRRRSPTPENVKCSSKDRQRRGRSRSKDSPNHRQSERGRSRSRESGKEREVLRKRTVSPAIARSHVRGRSRSREAVRERRTGGDGQDRKKRSRSPDSSHERRHSKDNYDNLDRVRRSRSPESGRLKPATRAESVDRRRRSRSRESLRERRVSTEWGSSRRAESMERRRRSRSRESSHKRVDEREGNRHGEGTEKRRGSRSRDIPRDYKGDDRDNSRHEWRVDDGPYKSSRDDRNYRDSRQFENNRENMYKMDREKDRNGNNFHDRNRGHKASQFKDDQHVSKGSLAESAMEEENQEEYQERVASQLAAQEEDDPEKIKEESRRRRQAILEKYKRQQQQKAAEEPSTNCIQGTNNDDVEDHLVDQSNGSTPGATAPVGVEAMSSDVELSLGKGALQNGALSKQTNVDGGLGAGSPKSERSADMFCDDIFGESPAGGRRLGKGDGLAMDTSGLTDNWDDAEGYYCFRIGEVLDGRYEVASSHGRGVFSTVVRARDLKAGRGEPEEVAIKIIRNNETMFKAGQQELVILKKLAGADPENKRHCVRLLSSFEYRSHLCLVFESLHMNLREILKKFGRNIGINLNAVRAYAKQLFIALKHLKNCGVLHCDIKPDNMLVNEAKNVLKLCDFGSAMFAGENEITPYLVSRFYRAPEIILGLPYDHALDIWSVGCCLYELYTGKMLFPGHTNNDMLRLHMELKGPFPKKMLKKAAFADQHFDQDFNFCAIEEDPVTKKTIKRILVNVRPKDMGILVNSSGSIDEDAKLQASFKDLLEKIFILDPDKRLTVSQALNHSFISGK